MVPGPKTTKKAHSQGDSDNTGTPRCVKGVKGVKGKSMPNGDSETRILFWRTAFWGAAACIVGVIGTFFTMLLVTKSFEHITRAEAVELINSHPDSWQKDRGLVMAHIQSTNIHESPDAKRQRIESVVEPLMREIRVELNNIKAKQEKNGLKLDRVAEDVAVLKADPERHTNRSP